MTQSTPSCLCLPTIDLTEFLLNPYSPKSQIDAKLAADSLIEYSACAIKDPRVSPHHNTQFINMLEDYFDQPLNLKMEDVRKEYYHQVGAVHFIHLYSFI